MGAGRAGERTARRVALGVRKQRAPTALEVIMKRLGLSVLVGIALSSGLAVARLPDSGRPPAFEEARETVRTYVSMKVDCA